MHGLFEVIARLRGEGVGIIYISHRLEECWRSPTASRSCATARVSRPGRRGGIDRAQLIRLMVGRDLAAIFPKRDVPRGEVALDVRGLSHRATGVHDVSFSVARGEILGLAGLVGSGRTQLAETLFGLTPADSGEIRVAGRPCQSARRRTRSRAGLGVRPGRSAAAWRRARDVRRGQREPGQPGAVSSRGLIDRAAERANAATYVERFRIKTPSVDDRSAGRSRAATSRRSRWRDGSRPSRPCSILDEPTQGVDVGSKAEIHALMQDLAERGLAILMISSELPEILGMSDRIAVMRRGTIAGVLAARGGDGRTPSLAMALDPQ